MFKREEKKLKPEEEKILIEDIKNSKYAIVTTEHTCWIYGSEAELLAGLSSIVMSMYSQGITDRELYEKALVLGLVDKKEFPKVALQELKKILEKMED